LTWNILHKCYRTTFQTTDAAQTTDKAETTTPDSDEPVERTPEHDEKSPDGVKESSEEEPKKAAGASG